jgi:hypothetical protein
MWVSLMKYDISVPVRAAHRSTSRGCQIIFKVPDNGSWPIWVRSFPSLSLVYTNKGFCRKIGPLTDVALPWQTRERNGGSAVTFEEILDQSLAMPQRRGRVTYRTQQRQFNLDDAGLEDLKEALLYAHPHVAEDPGHGLLWRGETTSTPLPVSSAPQPAPRLAAEDLHTCRKILDMRGHHCYGMERIVIKSLWEGVVMQQPTRFKKGDKVLVKETVKKA